MNRWQHVRDLGIPEPQAPPEGRSCRNLGVLAAAVAVGLVLLVALGACRSPNRGYWKGDFAGGVSGIVEFEINARGTKVTGKMTGQTSWGQPFEATMKGILRQDFLRTTFEGTSRGDFGLPIAFEGTMMGSLENGAGNGEWSAEVRRAGSAYQGTWSVQQVHR